MEVYSVYVFKLGLEDNYWEWKDEIGGEIILFKNFQEDVDDELLGVFSSEEKAEEAVRLYLEDYDIDDDMYEHPLRGISLVKNTLDELGDSVFVKWMRGSDTDIPQIPYK